MSTPTSRNGADASANQHHRRPHPRGLPVALLAVASVVLAGASGSRGLPVPDTARTFRVASFNIHKGADRRGRYDLERTIEAIHDLGADLVGVQEAMRNHPHFNCDDQPALIAEGLRKRTGRRWTYIYAQAWITEDRQCLERSRGDGVATEGLAFFAAERIIGSSSVRLSEGRVGLAVRVAAMPHVPVIVTHLAASRRNQPDRVRELGRLLPWAAQHGPGILIGDFNATPTAVELRPVLAHYRDAWAGAVAQGTAGGVVSGSTRLGRRVSRIDYVFYEPGVDLVLESMEVVDTSTRPELGEVSDHRPVVATFRRVPTAN